MEELEAVCVHSEHLGGGIVPGQLLGELRDRNAEEQEFCNKMDEGVLSEVLRTFELPRRLKAGGSFSRQVHTSYAMVAGSCFP